MKRYAIVQNNVVTNVCMWDGATAWQAPANATLVQSDTCNVGDTYDPATQVFTNPNPPTPAPTPAPTPTGT